MGGPDDSQTPEIPEDPADEMQDAEAALKALLRRTFIPVILFVPDVASVLCLTNSAARKMVVRGELGPFINLGKRLALRRETFFAALKKLEIERDPDRYRLTSWPYRRPPRGRPPKTP